MSGYTESKISGLKHDDANVFSTTSISRSNLESSKRMPLLGTVTVFFKLYCIAGQIRQLSAQKALLHDGAGATPKYAELRLEILKDTTKVNQKRNLSRKRILNSDEITQARNFFNQK